MTYFDSINDRPIIPLGSLIFQCTTETTESNKSVTFPSYLDIESNYTFKINFQNGYNKTSASAMTLNGKLVKVVDGGTLKNLPSHNINNSYKYLDPNTVLELYYNGTDFVVIGNPIVLKSSTYVVYADGKIGDDAVGTISIYGGSTAPYGYFICDGRAIPRNNYSELFNIIGTNFGSGNGSTTFNIPDFRESSPKGVGLTSNSTNHINSTGLSLGEFIDDRVQTHNHLVANQSGKYGNNVNSGYMATSIDNNTFGERYTNENLCRRGDTTEVKSIGVNFIIKY